MKAKSDKATSEINGGKAFSQATATRCQDILNTIWEELPRFDDDGEKLFFLFARFVFEQKTLESILLRLETIRDDYLSLYGEINKAHAPSTDLPSPDDMAQLKQLIALYEDFCSLYNTAVPLLSAPKYKNDASALLYGHNMINLDLEELFSERLLLRSGDVFPLTQVCLEFFNSHSDRILPSAFPNGQEKFIEKLAARLLKLKLLQAVQKKGIIIARSEMTVEEIFDSYCSEFTETLVEGLRNLYFIFRLQDKYLDAFSLASKPILHDVLKNADAETDEKVISVVRKLLYNRF